MELRNDGALLNAFQAIINNDTTGLGDASRDKFVGNSINLAYSSLSRMELQALYRSSAICQKVVDLLPKAATSENWLEVLLDKGKQGISGKVFQYAEDLKFRAAIREAAIMGRLDGDGFVVIGVDDGRSPAQPVNENAIRQISWVVPLNRYQLFPDPNSGRPGHPEYYQLYLQRTEALQSQGQAITTGKIHRSRVLRIPGKQLYSDLIYVNSGYNDSVLQAFYQSFSKYLVALEYSARMVQDYNLFIYKLKGLANLILQGKEADILKRFRAINLSMSSLGGLAMDNENEDGQFISRNYAGLDQIIDRLKDDTSAASGMPPTKLWGSSQKSALSNSSDGDKYEWANCVADYRSEMLHEPVLDFFKLVFLAKNGPTSGRLPESWSVKYASALRLTLKEQVELRKAQTQGVDVPSINAKILLPEEVRASAWSGAEYSVERSLQPDLYAKQQAAAKESANPQPEPGQPPEPEAEEPEEPESTSPDDFLANTQAEFGRKDAADLPITSEQLLDLKEITEEASPDGIEAIRDVSLDDEGRLTWIFRDENQLLRATLADGVLLTDYLGEVGQPKTDAADNGVLRLIERADKHLRSLEDRAIDRVNAALESSYKSLEAKLLELYSQDSGGSVMAKQRALVLLSQVSDLLTLLNTRNADAIQQQFEDLLRGAGNAGASLAQELVQAIANQSLQTFAQVPVAAVRFAAQNAVRRLKNHGEEFREKVSTLVIQGLIQGWGTDAIAREMRRELNVTQSKAVMIARTEVLAASNDATQATYEANGIEAFQLIATLDDRTCPYCAARNMQVYRLGESQPPLHPHCRCYSLPWKQEWQRLGLTNDAWASQYRQKAIADLKTQGLEPNDGASPFEKANGQTAATPLWTPSLLTLDELRLDKWNRRGKNKPRNCKAGRSCGGGCVSMSKQCKHDLSPGAKKKGGAIAKAVGAKKGGGGGASETAVAEPTPQSTEKQPDQTPETAKAPSTVQEYMQHGEGLIPADLKRSLDKLRETSGSAALVQARDAAKQELNQKRRQVADLQAKGQPLPKDLESDIRETLDLHKRLNQKVEKQIQDHTQAMQEFRESLIASSTSSKKDALEFANSLQIDKSAADVKNAREIRRDAYEYHLLTNGGGAETIQKITKDKDRAYARPHEQMVNIGAEPSKAIIFHEMAHHLEAGNSALGDASLKWIQSKATGGLQKLSTITGNPNYKDSEIAYKDHYLSPYIGKVYMDRSGKPRPVSEVISMGVERMSSPKAMVQFYLQDPQHFTFTLGVMRGRNQ